MTDFDKAMLDEVRVRKLPLHKLNAGAADRLRQAGLIEKWDYRANAAAVHSSTAVMWRITDAGLKELGKERIW